MDFRVDPDIRVAEGLPAECFASEAFLRRELDAIFRRSWTLLPQPAHAGERSLLDCVAARGARLPVELLGQPAFLQRGWDDEDLRLFPNACTHAWFPLVAGPSRTPSLTCAQHGRKFDCSGRFVSQPGFEPAESPPRACDDLVSLPLATWNGLLFGAAEPPARDLHEIMAPVDDSLARLDLGRLRRSEAASSVREVEGNWKLHAANYMDSFHLAFIHRAPGGLADRIDLASYRTELEGDVALQWAFARDPAHGFAPERLPGRFADPAGRRVFALWWFVFPSTAINIYPWGISVNAWIPVPGRPERTLFAWEHLVLDEAKHAQRDSTWLSAQVDAEDVDAMAQARRGLRAPVTPRTRFAPGHEAGPHWLHRLVSERVAALEETP